MKHHIMMIEMYLALSDLPVALLQLFRKRIQMKYALDKANKALLTLG